MKIALIAEESAGVQVLRAITKTNHTLSMVLASPKQAEKKSVSTWRVAQELGYEPLPAKLVKSTEFADRIRDVGIDLLLNVHSLYIIRGEVLTPVRVGCFNLHPGPLPRYAGLNAPSWAVYRGEKNHGVTLHHMTPGIDTGAIAYQTIFDLEKNATGLSVSARCIREGVLLIQKLLETIDMDPSLVPRIEQDLAQREYFGREVPEGGRISWSRPAAEVDRFIRAADYFPFESPWGHLKARFRGDPVEIIKVTLTGINSNEHPGVIHKSVEKGIMVSCQDEWLQIKLIKYEGKNIDPTVIFNQGDCLEDGL